jgi:glycosyltransferase involved in cell wall biosynthesis
MRIGIVNPLPSALGHFQKALIDNLQLNDDITVVEIATSGTEMPAGSRNLDRVRHAIRFIRSARSTARRTDVDCIINVWPTFGYLEALLWRAVRPRVPVKTILHDVRPLRRQFGYSKRAIGPLDLGRTDSHAWLVHTDVASDEAELLGLGRPDVIPHPILPESDCATERSLDVLVFGQFKPARDLDLLAELGPELGARRRSTRIVGRGWQAIDGWELDDRFVDEADVAKLLGDARVVLIPYRKYYQSGVALRAMEVGTPIVGLRTPFLEDYLGTDWPGLIDPEDESVQAWIAAIDAVIDTQGTSVLRAADVARTRVAGEWKAALMPSEAALQV